MNLISWGISLLILLAIVAKLITFQQKTSCRQIAWLKGTELLTANLLEKNSNSRDFIISCKIYLTRKDSSVVWKYFDEASEKKFEIGLEGRL